MSTYDDLAFKPVHSCYRNFIEREIDSVSSCAINLDWDTLTWREREGHPRSYGWKEECTITLGAWRQMDEIGVVLGSFISDWIVFTNFNISPRVDACLGPPRRWQNRRGNVQLMEIFFRWDCERLNARGNGYRLVGTSLIPGDLFRGANREIYVRAVETGERYHLLYILPLRWFGTRKIKFQIRVGFVGFGSCTESMTALFDFSR